MGSLPLSSYALFDPAPLDQMARDVDTATVSQLVATALRDIPRRYAELLKSWEEKNWPEMHRHAHSLKGAAGSCGLPRVAELMRQIEHCAQQQAPEAEQTDVEKRAAHLLAEAAGIMLPSLTALRGYGG